MTKVDAWSFSRYNTYAQCPAKFKYQNIDKLPTPTSDAMEFGKTVHKAAEDYLLGRRPDIIPELETRTDLLHALKGLDTRVEQNWGFARDWSPTGWFKEAGKPNPWLRAKLDVGIDYGDGSFEVIDWKTGKKRGDNQEQMQLFAVAVMAKYPNVHTVNTRLSYTKLQPGEASETYGEYFRQDYDTLVKTWERRVKPMMEDETFEPTPNRLCGWCPFSNANGGPCLAG